MRDETRPTRAPRAHCGSGRSLVALVCALVAALFTAPALAQPAVCRVGAYVLDLSSIDFGAQQVHVDALVWIRCPTSVSRENMVLSVMGAVAEARSEAYTEESDGERYSSERIRATLRVPLSLRRYPFDTQRIRLNLESTNATASEVRFAPDDDPVLRTRPCCLDEAVKVPNWHIESSVPMIGIHRYQTRFGYTIGQADAQIYPHFHVELTLRREVRAYLWKLLLPLAILLMIVFASSFLPPTRLEASSLVLIGALLAVVLAHLSQRNELPNTGYLVTGDLFFVHTYLSLLLLFAVTVRAHLAHASGEPDEALWLQRTARRILPVFVLGGWALVARLG